VRKPEGKGLVQLYIGDGKGKTTASLGLALRAVGWGWKVLYLQFFKKRFTGELASTQCLPGVEFYQFGSGEFLIGREPSELDFKEFRCGWEVAKKALLEGGWDLLVLDEFCYAFLYHFLSFSEFEQVLQNKVDFLEVVITGRKAPPELIERADLVSEVKCLKHPFQKGVPAREGIEF